MVYKRAGSSTSPVRESTVNAKIEACTAKIRRGIQLMHAQRERLDGMYRRGADPHDAYVLYERLYMSVLTLVRLCAGAELDARW